MMHGKNDISDFDLQAYVDGELEERARQRLLEAVERDKLLRHRLETLQKQKALLGLWWGNEKPM